MIYQEFKSFSQFFRFCIAINLKNIRNIILTLNVLIALEFFINNGKEKNVLYQIDRANAINYIIRK